jgi:TatD DNase family protein
MQYEYFDIHSHIDSSQFDNDREEEIAKLKEAKIATTTIGVDFSSSQVAITLAEKHENLFACIGQHPGDLIEDSTFDERLTPMAEHPKVVAIGETGLDYFRLEGDTTLIKSIQKTIFQYHIDLALAIDKPLMLHIRSSKGTYDAYVDALEILEHYSQISGKKLRGNAHFFAGNLEILKRFMDIGFTVSFNGVLTFTHDYDEFVKTVPLSMIMSETDTPFLAPVPYRGERNSPLHIPLVVSKIAEIRGESLETVKKALVDNALRNFRIQNS